jgi:Rha family phage regulatory protein
MNQISDFQGFVTAERGHVLTDSRRVARAFGKQHRHVLRSIRDLIAKTGAWGVSNFAHTPEANAQNGQSYDLYRITKDGFMLLVMGFTGDAALKVKMAFIGAFNAMKDYIERERDTNMGEALDALADLKAQNQIGSFHGRGLARHKVAKPAKVRRFALAMERAQLSFSY